MCVSRSSRLFLFLSVLLAASLACQTVTGVLFPEPTASLAPLAAPPEQDSQPAPTPQPTVAPPASTETNDLSLAEQLEIFDDLWQIIDEEYLYEDFNGLDWDAVYTEYEASIQAGLNDQDFYYAMDEMVYRLGDDHSVFLSPEDVAVEEAEYAGDTEYVGIGIYVGLNVAGDRMVIYQTFPDSPAEAAGIKAHDTLLAADGEAIIDQNGHIRDILLGPEGSDVLVTVQSPGEAQRDVLVTRARITGSLAVESHILTSPEGKRVGYILIPTFADGTIANQVGDAIRALNADGPLDALILDNRINGGGFDDVMSGALGYFAGGVVGHYVNRQGREALQVNAHDVKGSLDVPLVVLIGVDTVSFGEVFAGVLQDLRRATLIGETTGGNVETLWGYDFDDGSRAWIAHDTFRPAHHPEVDWETSGIIPDISAPTLWEEITLENDPALDAALDFFDAQ